MNSPLNRRGSKPTKLKWKISKSPQNNNVTENIIEENNGINLMIKGLMNVKNISPDNIGKPNFFRKKLKEIQHRIRNSKLKREEKKEIDMNVYRLSC